MFKHKLTGALLAAAFVVAGAGMLAEPLPASAAQEQLHLDAQTASLSLPESYEQYLELESPSDIAFSERYVAIAEQDMLYLFDRTEENAQYRIYRHGANHNDAKISKIQFSDEGKLYFSDSLLGFYELDLTNLDAMTPSDALNHLSTFYLVGETLFMVSVTSESTTYLTAPLSDPDSSVKFGTTDNKVTPQLGFSDGNFYSVVGELVTRYSYVDETYKATKSFSLSPGLSGLKSATVVGGSLFYTVSGSGGVTSGLYRCDLATETSELLFEAEGYGALTSYGGMLYAVKGSSVLQYSLDGAVTKTNYEISSASDSVNRLNGAKDIACTRDLLVVADTGNKRISVAVLNGKENGVPITDISVIPCVDNKNQPFAPELVATDGEIVAIASLEENKSCIYIYHIGNNVLSECYPIDEQVIDIACVNGACYYITVSGRGKAADGCKTIMCQDSLPSALTADEYGILYVVDQTGNVQSYTEEDFIDCSVMNGDVTGDYIRFPFTSLQTDGKGNFYYIANKTLYMNETELCRFEETRFVNNEREQIHEPSAFIIDFQDNEVFLLYENYIVMVPLKLAEQ